MIKVLLLNFVILNYFWIGIVNCEEVSTDYSPATKALNYLNNIKSNYNSFKHRVEKNLSLEYTKCVDSINTLKCQNVDQWQSVIEELKLEINNSQSTEVPFLTDRKEKKVSELEGLLNRSAIDNENYTELAETLKEHQQRIMNKMYYIQQMYKLPKIAAFIQEGPAEEQPKEEQPKEEQPKEEQPKEEQSKEEQPKEEQPKEETNTVVADLNADVPDIAKEELGKAKNDYELADLSIQAQTTANMLRNYGQKCSETLEHLEQSYQGRLEDLMQKKLKIKQDILKVRQMLINENKIKEKNQAKIAEMEEKISKCQGKPTNVEKDCEPLRVNGNKILTEIDIVNARTLILHKEVSKLLLENYSPEELKAIFEEQVPKPVAIDENDYYLNEPTQKKKNKTVQYEPREPQELFPIYHYKDQLKGKPKEEQNKEDEPATEEAPSEGEATEETPSEAESESTQPTEEAPEVQEEPIEAPEGEQE